MTDTPNLIMIDRAKLDKLLEGVFPQSPGVRDEVIDNLVHKETPRGVTPNRQDRGSGLVKQAIRLSKMLDQPLDLILEMLVRTTDVWDERTSYRTQLIGAYRQIKRFLGERLEMSHADAAWREDEEKMQKTIFELTWKLQDLEAADAEDAKVREQIRNA